MPCYEALGSKILQFDTTFFALGEGSSEVDNCRVLVSLPKELLFSILVRRTNLRGVPEFKTEALAYLLYKVNPELGAASVKLELSGVE